MNREGGPPRITGGDLRGRVVNVPQTGDVRPMLGRTRQALFNVLGNAVTGPAWDCFGGSGLLAFEALSRGASHAVIIELDSRHARVIGQNVDDLGVANGCSIIRGSAFRSIRPGRELAHSPAGLVFLDPPHALARDHESEFWPWLRSLPATPLLSADTTVVLGHPAGFALPNIDALRVRDQREYGTVAFTLLAAC
jgi:16S rRNA (guanine966-N2)-methyltransferase